MDVSWDLICTSYCGGVEMCSSWHLSLGIYYIKRLKSDIFINILLSNVSGHAVYVIPQIAEYCTSKMLVNIYFQMQFYSSWCLKSDCFHITKFYLFLLFSGALINLIFILLCTSANQVQLQFP